MKTTAGQALRFAACARAPMRQARIHDLMASRPTLINPATSIPDAATLMSRGHFRHLPVSGCTGLIGVLDITDVCRALIDPDLSQRPITGNALSLQPQRALPVVRSACRTRQYVRWPVVRLRQADGARFGNRRRGG
jgi:hypothetical protein